MAKVDLSNIKESELRAEIARREALRKEEERQKRLKDYKTLKTILQQIPDSLDLLAGDHSHRDGSDETPEHAAGCARCFLLRIRAEEEWEDGDQWEGVRHEVIVGF